MSRPEHPAWRSPLHTIRDRISFAAAAAPLRQPSFAIVDQLQFHDPAIQLDALFLTAVAMASVVGLDPHEMVARARRILPEAEGPFTEQLQAARDYAKGELR
jgi:hypothetical protein